MREITFKGAPAYLLDDPPQGDQEGRVEIIAGVDSSLSNRESRRAYSASLRLSLSLNCLVDGVGARRTAGVLRDYQVQPVLVAFWPFVTYLGDIAESPVRTPWWVLLRDDDLGGPLVFADGSPPALAANSQIAPVLIGRLDGRRLDWTGPDQAEWSVEFIEQGDHADSVSVTEFPFPVGPLPPSGYASAPLFFNFTVNSRSTEEELTVSVVRDLIGFTRRPLEAVYPQVNAASRSDEYAMLGNVDLAALLHWFKLHGGGAPFWTSDYTSAVAITAPVAEGATILTVTDTLAVRAGDYLVAHNAAIDASPGSSGFARIGSLSSNAVTLAAPFTCGLDPLTSLVARLRLVRMAKPVLAFRWNGESAAEVNLPVVEVPPEVSPPADEAVGTTLGRLPTRAFLYEFTALGMTPAYYTSFESPLLYAARTYTPQIIGHGNVKQGLALDNDLIEIESAIWTGNPLLALATLRAETPLLLTVIECEAAGGNAINQRVLFAGEVLAPRVSGFRLSATVSPLGTMFDQLVPRVIIGNVCNWRRGPTREGLFLMSAGCSLLRSDWRFTATVSNPGTVGYPYEFVLSGLARTTGPVPTYFDDWFAGGWIEFGTTASASRRAIVRSSTPAAGSLSVWVSRDPDPFPAAGLAVVLYPTCDGARETCNPYSASNPLGKFNNWANFGGHPWVPVGNPSLIKAPTAKAGGKEMSEGTVIAGWFDAPERVARLRVAADVWRGTPFAGNGSSPGMGVSCQMLAYGLLHGAGFEMPEPPHGPMGHDRFHTTSLIEPWVEATGRFTDCPPETVPQAGDLIGFHLYNAVHHVGVCVDFGVFFNVTNTGAYERSLSDLTWATRLRRVWRPRP